MRRAFAVSAFLLALLGTAGWWRSRGAAGPDRVLLLPPAAGPGLGPAEAEALGGLIEDELDLRGGRPVTVLDQLPQAFRPGARTLVLRPACAREGGALQLALDWEDWSPGRGGPRSSGTARGAGPPAGAMEGALAGLPLRLDPPEPLLLPPSPEGFWTLLKSDAAAFGNEDLGAAEGLLLGLPAPDRSSAAAQAALARLELLRVLQAPQALSGHAALALAAADRAVQAVPGYPRALRAAARLLSDQGRQEEAFPRLSAGLRRRPAALPLLFALDYAARTAGLLGVASSARARIQDLWAGGPVPPPVAFTALYEGHPEAFEASLEGDPREAPAGFEAFYLGYASLIQGRREEALARFQAALADPGAEAHLRALARVFWFRLQGRDEEARQALEDLDRARVGLQVPDGEFTLTMAEAAAFLGEEGRAMDLAQRAFSQGFTCPEWYRGSPLLAPLQAFPRWRALLQHVDARRARLASHHRPGEFGL